MSFPENSGPFTHDRFYLGNEKGLDLKGIPGTLVEPGGMIGVPLRAIADAARNRKNANDDILWLRPDTPPPTCYFDDGLVIDHATGGVLVDGEVRRLRRKPLSILRFLCAHPNEVQSVQQIFNNVWPEGTWEALSKNRVEVQVSDARRNIAPYSWSIHTKRHQGYVFLTERPPKSHRSKKKEG